MSQLRQLPTTDVFRVQPQILHHRLIDMALTLVVAYLCLLLTKNREVKNENSQNHQYLQEQLHGGSRASRGKSAGDIRCRCIL